MSARLLYELAQAALNVRQPHLDRIRGLGVSISWLADCSTYPFGVARCEPIGGGLYQPSEGKLHVVIPVIEDGVLIDLCAFRSTAPGEWLLRTGNGWALGLEQGLSEWMWHAPADPQAKPPRYQVGQPPTLFADPLDWLRGQGDGLCILDWGSPEIRSLDVLHHVICSTPAVAALLRRALTRPARLPQITVMEARHVA